MNLNPIKKTFLSWSSGKDAALALYKLQQNPGVHVQKLLTTINSHYERVSMHGLRESVLDRQLSSLEIPIQKVGLPKDAGMGVYNRVMETALNQLVSEGYTHGAFGDIFLEDLKKYRENQLQKNRLQTLFPLWKQDTKSLIEAFLQLGFEAITVAVNGAILDKSFVGKRLDKVFFERLPKGVDPCGENGEFHTFCYKGPIFKRPVLFTKGDIISRSYPDPKGGAPVPYLFCDILPT
jgi:uncharacterized protein (TIGR00290 family)